MEKLQQALEKARIARSEPQARPFGSQTAPAAASRKASSPAGPQAAWSALKPAEFDPAVLERNRIVTYDASSGATHFDILRTKILLQMRKNGWKRLAITSPTASCGKTTTVCNLALGLSRQEDITAMAFEMDLRRPNMVPLLGIRPDRDITKMLTGEVPFAEQALRVRSNVALSMAKQSSKDPTRYMLNQETMERLGELEAAYDPTLMIFDLPPLLVSDDTRAFLGNVDCALMIARAEKTSIAQIDTCEREIAEHTNMLGVVLNQCRFADDVGYYDYGGYESS